MDKKIELLAPGGDLDSIKAAILAGADAVYCGLNKFNARNRASNIGFEELVGVIHLAHQHHCEVFLTLNILILESEIPNLITLLNKLVNTSIDGVIIQDLGLFYILTNYFPTLRVHASTQLTTHNEGQIKALSKLKAERVNLSRELNLSEIKHLTSVGQQHQVSTEVFVHGSNCISFSGQCYMSSVYGGQSGNRGRCSQPCRDKFEPTRMGKTYPLNMKDNAAYLDVNSLIDAGVYSLKVEGRIKKHDYIHTVISTYKEQINSYLKNKDLLNDKEKLYTVFNRDFSNGYLHSGISNSMFIDNPRDNTLLRVQKIHSDVSDAERQHAERELLRHKEELKAIVEARINAISIEKLDLKLYVSGTEGQPLKITAKTPTDTYILESKLKLRVNKTEALNYDSIYKRLKALNETNYTISDIDLSELSEQVFLPFKELTTLKNDLFYLLNEQAFVAPIKLPKLKHEVSHKKETALSIIISSIDDKDLSTKASSTFYKMPSDLTSQEKRLEEFFLKHRNITPWFPSILIGNEFAQAVSFLKKVQPTRIVTDNLGIAMEAFKQDINWIAGPQLNLTNSYSILCLKEEFNCSGAFISDELNKQQMLGIKAPKDFELHYQIYHPIVLMTTRQCLFQQTTGCYKPQVDEHCINDCVKQTSITKENGSSFIIDKNKGSHHYVYASHNCLNTDIITDFPNKFDSFCTDFSQIKTATDLGNNKHEIIEQFNGLIKDSSESSNSIQESIKPTINANYNKGI
ncbi:peptidase U32 family protein [Labilibacter marinus]|uniref:peptidase U32 family protein n=1 Tax=Labilibacter marinus TaxID=1477105 RepID=UPI00094F87C2|nr:peptidase U32 family protein [Labilibacter marinus]